ncbi:MAG: hypothetical protein OR996_00185 [Phycisphaerales bacterium]|jgi:hypothetical protein|nr:hypothetical protein [Phycisphaerae bacterium]MBT7657987.1 hypothetical protein [Phycisphaerae bacterium]MDE1037236.1 hypothetical protein [Phycisphaerales bacterium]|tara:strand:+ start:1150 stop:1479 length:330 start_codon:yes stop_codon:yes gene_type:complete
MSDEPKQEIEKVEQEQEGVPHFVTPLLHIARQVGEHVLSAMEHEETVAVLTTITGSNQGQQVISVPLTAEHMQQVHSLISEIHTSDEPESVACVGFHCLLDQEETEEDS